MARLQSASVAFVVSMASACQTYTSVGQTVHYPAGSDHANAQYHLVIGVDGARGRPYVDRTTKSVHVTIWKRDTQVLEREYRLTAGDLKWNVVWTSLDDLRIVFFEYGEPVREKEPSPGLA